MKDTKRILAFVLTLVMMISMASACVFATGTKAAEPVTLSIVSPTNNSVNESGSFFISVRINNPGKVKVSVYEQCIEKTEILSTGSAAAGNFATYASIKYESVNTSTFAAADFVSNPALATYVSREYLKPEVYESTGNMGFYTKSLENVKPGIYRFVAEVLDENGKTVNSAESLMAVKEKPAKVEEENSKVFETKSGALKLLQNILNLLNNNK